MLLEVHAWHWHWLVRRPKPEPEPEHLCGKQEGARRLNRRQDPGPSRKLSPKNRQKCRCQFFLDLFCFIAVSGVLQKMFYKTNRVEELLQKGRPRTPEFQRQYAVRATLNHTGDRGHLPQVQRVCSSLES
jgi:hypothetical protein